MDSYDLGSLTALIDYYAEVALAYRLAGAGALLAGLGLFGNGVANVVRALKGRKK